MSEKDELPSLTIKDKVNFPYILANQMLTFQKAILNQEFSEREIREAVNGFVELIPDSWKDEDWKSDLEKAKVIEKKDVRPVVAGTIRMSKEVCSRLGIPVFNEEETYDSYKLFHSCVNLLDRRGMISKVTKIDKVLGERFGDGYKEDR